VAEECVAGTNPSSFSGPPAPELLDPSDGLTVTIAEFDFVWKNVIDPDGDSLEYELELHDTEDFSSLVNRYENIAARTGVTTFLREEPTLIEDTRYWWRVRAVTSDVDGPWSESFEFNFNVVNSAPSRPTIDSPTAIADSLNPVVRVVNASDPDGDILLYEFEVFDGAGVGGLRIASQSDVAEGDGGITTWTSTVSLVEDGTYTLRVRAVDTGRPSRSSAYDVRTFVVDTSNTAPTTPVLVAPVGDERVAVLDTLALSWQPSTDEDGDSISYRVQLATTDDFAVILVDTNVEPEIPGELVNVIVPFRLATGTTYHWRVQASDGRTTSDFAFAQFTSAGANQPPPPPTLISPVAGRQAAQDEDGLVELRWQNAVDPDSDSGVFYELQVASREAMDALLATASGIVDDPSGETTYLVNIRIGQTAFWRVRGNDGSATGEWSEIEQFTVVANGTEIPDEEDAGGDTGSDADTSDGFTSDAGSTDGSGDASDEDEGSAGGSGGGDGGGCAATAASPGSASLLPVLAVAVLLVTRRRRLRSV
jgi:uncharacterized protein (TIGR03382 family)